jgi:hypothetical protein
MLRLLVAMEILFIELFPGYRFWVTCGRFPWKAPTKLLWPESSTQRKSIEGMATKKQIRAQLTIALSCIERNRRKAGTASLLKSCNQLGSCSSQFSKATTFKKGK